MGLSSQAFALVARYPPRPTEPFSLSPATDQLDRRLLFCYSTLTTSFIILRILLVTGVKHARTYRGLIEILIQSGTFMYSATYIVYFTLYVCIASWSYNYSYVDRLLNALTVCVFRGDKK
ncbi:hypothetical protein CPB85DRAFT_1334398 [Mucidula mucida]|nr:hypothetical protein CPB85DRAFT_1334398 [Mucidula mucida]